MKKKAILLFSLFFVFYWFSCSLTNKGYKNFIVRKHPLGTNIIPAATTFYKDVLPTLRGKKVALITNPSGIGQNPDKISQKFRQHSVSIEFLIGLEHGFLGLEEDFSSKSQDVDAIFKLPIYHIYRTKKNKLRSLLAEVDAVIFDVQDVGMRCYTYLTVLKRVMDTLKADVRLVLLDHINPGIHFRPRGQMMRAKLYNFAGEFPSLFISGLTIGESASYYNHALLNSKVNLTVITVKNYQRGTNFEEAGIVWNTPSPNLPNLDSARNYYSLVLLEGINVSVGRGTQAPFVYFGAPWFKTPDKLAQALNQTSNREYYYQVVYFKPDFGPYAGKICKGLRLTIVNTNYDPIRAGYILVQTLKKFYPKNFRWRKSGRRFWLDMFWGTTDFRKSIDAGKNYWDFHKLFSKVEEDMYEKVKLYRIY